MLDIALLVVMVVKWIILGLLGTFILIIGIATFRVITGQDKMTKEENALKTKIGIKETVSAVIKNKNERRVH